MAIMIVGLYGLTQQTKAGTKIFRIEETGQTFDESEFASWAGARDTMFKSEPIELLME